LVLEAAPSVTYKAALSVAYGAGLRASEVVLLIPGEAAHHNEMIAPTVTE
jgi:hypothetical protein